MAHLDKDIMDRVDEGLSISLGSRKYRYIMISCMKGVLKCRKTLWDSPGCISPICPLLFEGTPRFSRVLGGPQIFIKRDDATALALGGNKARKLEFLLGDALAKQCDTVITAGGPQPNH